MLAVINELTDKPDWHKKVHDEEIVSKWKKEAMSREGVDFSEKMFDYCVEELRDKAARFENTGRVIVLDSEAAIVKSDTAIPSFLAEELKAVVKPLEDVPERLKDWHPDSNNMVLDLVHPSLYPLMYGKSRVIPSGRIHLDDALESCGKGVMVSKPDREDLYLAKAHSHLKNGLSRADARHTFDLHPKVFDYWSDSYQWLPSQVEFRGEDEVGFTSYINNLHPRHKELYTVLEKIIAKTIPMWNDCLSYFTFEEPRWRVTGSPEYDYPQGKIRPGSKASRTNNPKEDVDDEDGDEGDDESENEDEDDDEEEDEFELDERWLKDTRVLLQPEPHDYISYDPEILDWVDLRKQWKDQGLQVIVKLANIELRPEDGKTKYEGGTWHVEGQLNEHICASAIYYYDQENVTESRLAFRQMTSRSDLEEDESYEQDDYEGFEILYGITQGGPCLQTLGSVLTREGRMVVFPNVLQHQVQPFELVDTTKPGHRKILALFLVDPHMKTLSTENVPPQQRDWWAEIVKNDSMSKLGKLPQELKDRVVEMTDDWPISLEEAKEVRKDLMSKRKMYVGKVNRDYEGAGFSFCEH